MKVTGKLLIVGLIVTFAGGGPAHSAAKRNIDFKKIRGDMKIFEGIVNIALQQELGNPLAIVHEPKGVYLPGQGVTFTVMINPGRAVGETPFGRREIAGNNRPREMKIRSVRDRLIDLLSEYANAIDQVAPEENIVLAAHVESSLALNPADQYQVIILKVSKKDLIDYKANKITARQLRDRIERIEY